MQWTARPSLMGGAARVRPGIEQVRGRFTQGSSCVYPGWRPPVAHSPLRLPGVLAAQRYRTSSPVTACPMIMRWISDVPSKIVKLSGVSGVEQPRMLATYT